MNKIIFESEDRPTILLQGFKAAVEEVLNTNNIEGIPLRNILQELLPQFSLNSITLDYRGNVVLDERLYNAIEFGTLHIPKFQIISKAKRRMGRRPKWQIRS